MANRVKTSVYIDRQESIKNINNTLENLKLNNINIGFNTTSLNDLNKTINNVFDNLSTNFNKITSMNTVFYDKGNAVRNIANIKDELGNTLKVMQDVKNESTAFSLGNNFEKQEKELDKFNDEVLKLIQTINIAKSNNLLKTSAYDGLLNRANKLQFGDDNGLKNLQSAVNNISKSEQNVIRLRNTINDIKSSFENIKVSDNFSNIDTTSIENYKQSLKEAENLLNNKLRNNSQSITNSGISQITNNLKSSFSDIQNQVKEYDKLANSIEKARQQSELKANIQSNKDELNQTNAINKALEEEYRQRQKLQETLSNSSNKLNILSDNEIVDKNLINQAENDIKSLQSIFNNFNTDKSEKEIDELLTKITRLSQEDLSKMTKTEKLDTAVKSVSSNVNNISKSESQILTLNKTINTLENNLDALKTKYDKLVKINPESLQKFNSELEKLKTISSNVKSGDIIDGQKIKSQCDVARDSLSKLENEVKKDGFRTGKQDVNSFGEAVKNAFGNVGIYYGSSVAIREVFNAMKQGVQDVISVESAFVSLRRIVDMTDESANNLRQEFGQMALNLATSTTDITNSITDYAKLGYTLDEAKTLATETQKFNLAGDINNLGEATTNTVSALKGFGLEAKNVTEVLDAENTASNKYAVSAKGVAESLKRSASALKVTGNNYKESISMITVADEINQDSEKTGNALKSISANLVKTGKDGLKFRDKILNYTNFDISNGDGSLKNTFEIFKGIGKEWNKLTDEQKNSLGMDLFGRFCRSKIKQNRGKLNLKMAC